MAQYSHLPIYVKTYESVKLVYRIVKQFRKEYKHTLGAELQKIIWQILDEIIMANSLPDTEKKKVIKKISQLFDKFKIRFRFAYEMGLVTSEKFGVAQKEMEEIGRMIGGWRKWAG
jgi:23S rRNA-intervening sequence protein